MSQILFEFNGGWTHSGHSKQIIILKNIYIYITILSKYIYLSKGFKEQAHKPCELQTHGAKKAVE